MHYPKIAEELLAMEREDQQMRDKALDDAQAWDSSIDERNTERLRAIIAEIGWPTVSKVGSDASHAAWLIAQHADRNTEFQKEVLSLLEQQESGEIRKQEIAYLTDRVLVNEGKPQRFGTQFYRFEDGSLHARPLENPELVSTIRKEFELDTLEENIARMDKYRR